MQQSFASGELSPTLYARVDLAKYHTGVALSRNMFVDYRGGLSNRPGTKFIGQCKSSTYARLIPFQFSTVQAYALEFGEFYIRIIMNGGYVTDLTSNITGISQANPGVVTSAAHGFSNGDWIALVSIGGMTTLNGRTVIVANVTANTYTMVDPVTGANINTSAYTAYTAGGTASRIYTIVTPYTAADLPTLKYTQSADVMTLVHPNYAPRDLTRTGHSTWTLTINITTAALTSPAAPSVTASGTGASFYSYQVTAINANGDESIASIATSTTGVDITTATSGSIQIVWTAVANAVSYNVYKARQVKNTGGIFGTAAPVSTFYGFMDTTQSNQVTDSNITPDFSKTPPLARDPFSPGTLQLATVTATGAGYTSAPIVTLTGGGGTGGDIQAVINSTGLLVSLIVRNPGKNYTSAPALSFSGGAGAGAAGTVTIGALTGTYPSVVAYFQQRRVYAGSTNQPQTFWMGQPGLYYNFNVSDPVREDDAITGTLASLQVNAIKHLVPMPGGLVALTSYGAWQISGGGTNQPITPANAQAQAQAYNGASDLQPIIINYDVLYVQAKGSVVRDLAYNIYANIYTGDDITVLSNHFFFGYTLISWAYAEAPFKLVWVVRSDGKLLTLTFLKEQQVLGWTSHDTSGSFKSVCTISEGNEDAVYFIVQRTIQGFTVQYVERLASRYFNDNVGYSWFLDSGLQTFFGGPVTTVSGLWHLEGQTVSVFADGVAQANKIVVNGSITITAATTVLVGLAFTAQFQTLYLDIGEPTIQGKRKQIYGLTMRIAESSTFKVGPTFATVQAWKYDVQIFNGTVLNGLYTGDYRRNVGNGWNVPGQICIQQDLPYPLTILGVIPEIGVGDTEREKK